MESPPTLSARNTSAPASFLQIGYSILADHIELQILQGNINRSPSAYLANPADERAKYAYDQDKTMTLVKFTGASGDRGFLSFFPVRASPRYLFHAKLTMRLQVHGTSLYENNTLVSSDNKGMAAYLYESM